MYSAKLRDDYGRGARSASASPVCADACFTRFTRFALLGLHEGPKRLKLDNDDDRVPPQPSRQHLNCGYNGSLLDDDIYHRRHQQARGFSRYQQQAR